jgi:hypothetical protein
MHVVGYLALFVALGGTSYAAGDALSASSDTRIYACITKAHRTMNLAGRQHNCPAGQQLIAWNEKGQPGVSGATGADGARGPIGKTGARGPAGGIGLQGLKGETGGAGATGPQGSKGETGAIGPQGANGDAGPAGAPGARGATGDIGPAGAAGARGATGNTGAQGVAGAQGAPGTGPMLLSSAPATITTVAGGLSGQSAYLPFSGSLLQSNDDADSADGGTAAGLVLQTIPRDATLTGLTARFSTTTPLSLVGSTITLSAQVYLADDGTSVPQPVGVAICTGVPPLTGVVSTGTLSSCTISGLTIPVSAGAVGWVKVSATASGLTLINSIGLNTSVGVALS